MADAQLTETYRGLRRNTPLPCCTLTRDDLRTLYSRLSAEVGEGLELRLADMETPEDVDPDAWEALKQQARDAAHLTAMVFGARGEQVYTTEEEGLLDRNLPDRIVSVVFDSAVALKNTANVEAQNRFKVTLDFSAPPNFDQYDPGSQPTPNGSGLEVTGPDETWVSGVHDLVIEFFRSRETARRLLHSANLFLALQWLLVIPGSLWFSYRFGELLPEALIQAHPALTAGIYLYGFFLAFMVFRLIHLLARRAWPYVELSGDSRTLGRVVFSAVALGLAVAFLRDLVKNLFGL